MKRKMISVIVPAYNEEDCIEELVRRLAIVFDSNSNYDFEAVIVENGSTDLTFELLKKASMVDGRFKILRLSRNFGMDGGITAGLHHVHGDAAVIMTADLQDPPEFIPNFIRKWEEGYENIFMLVTNRGGVGPIRRFNSHAFYWLAGRMTGHVIARDASDFRLVDRKVYEAVKAMNERNRFVRGLFAWVGFRSIGLAAERPERFAGASKAYTFTVLDLAVKGILSHSYLPIKFVAVLGFSLSGLSGLAIVLLSIMWVVFGVPFAGFGTLIAVSLLLFGLLASLTGVVALYVGMIFEEVKSRPNFVVAEWIALRSFAEEGRD